MQLQLCCLMGHINSSLYLFHTLFSFSFSFRNINLSGQKFNAFCLMFYYHWIELNVCTIVLTVHNFTIICHVCMRAVQCARMCVFVYISLHRICAWTLNSAINLHNISIFILPTQVKNGREIKRVYTEQTNE